MDDFFLNILYRGVLKLLLHQTFGWQCTCQYILNVICDAKCLPSHLLFESYKRKYILLIVRARWRYCPVSKGELSCYFTQSMYHLSCYFVPGEANVRNGEKRNKIVNGKNKNKNMKDRDAKKPPLPYHR